MTRTAAFIAHELRTQGRSLRFRVAAAAYLIAGSLPGVVAYLHRTDGLYFFGGASYARETMGVLPLLTAVLALLLSLDGIGRERTGGAWTTLGLNDLTNAGYLLRRWLALQVVVVPLTALPVLAAAGLAAAGGAQGIEPSAFWGPWLVHILPLAVVATTLGLGLGTIGGSGMGIFVTAAFFLALLPMLINRVVEPLGYAFRDPLVWFDPGGASWTTGRIAKSLGGKGGEEWFWMFPAPASEAGFDLGTWAEQSLADGLLPAAVAALVFGLAVARLRRTRPDLRPWTVRPDHPLRSFLGLFGKLREALLPDPALSRVDRAVMILALLLAATAGGALLARADHYDERAWRLVRAEMKPPEPTPREVLPGPWRVEGTIAPDGEVALRVAGTLRNTGRTPQRHLAFSLNQELDVLEVTAEAGTARSEQVWDRLLLELDPPLGPGERRELRFRLAGRPARTYLPRRPQPYNLVDEAFGGHHRPRFANDLIGFASSYRVPAVSGYRVRLQAQDLMPVPRYGPWTFFLEFGVTPKVADETIFPKTDVSLSLSVPPGLFLADSCGGVARGGHLESRCALPLAEVTVAGGRHRLLPGDGAGGAAVAVFPAHQSVGELHLGFLARSSRMLGEAWPGVGGLAGTMVLEWPAEEIHRRGPQYWFSDDYRDPFKGFVDVRWRLIFLDESRLISSRPIPPESLVAGVVTSRLVQRRPIDPAQQLFFQQLFQKLALQRLGLGPELSAVVPGLDPQHLPMVHRPALNDEPGSYWYFRFPALVAALENRAGREPLRAAVDELLSRESAKPASFDEFEEILRRHAREPVDGLIRDFFRAGRMPELVLEDVSFRRAGAGWRAAGRVRNQADGEAVCQVVLAAAVAPVETTVTVGTGEMVSFSLETPHRPQAVLLDPDHECHRMLPKGAPRDVVYFEGERP